MKRDCVDCKFSGLDIADGWFCTHPIATKGYPYGLLLTQRIEKCLHPDHPFYERRPTPPAEGERKG